MWDYLDRLKERACVYFEKHVIGIMCVALLLVGGVRVFLWHNDVCIEVVGRWWQPADDCSFNFYGVGGSSVLETYHTDNCSGLGKYCFKDLPAWKGLFFNVNCGDDGLGSGSVTIVVGETIRSHKPLSKPMRTSVLGHRINRAKIIVTPIKPLSYLEDPGPLTAAWQAHQ